MTDPSAVLAECGLRCTRQRQEILRSLTGTRGHPTAEELHRLVVADNPSISLATVYNALEAFCAAGLARKLAMSEGPARFDAETHDHLHFVDGSGQVLDVPDDLGRLILDRIPREVLAELESRMGVRVRQVKIDLLGDRPARNSDV